MTRFVLSPDWSKEGSYWFDLWDHSARDDLYTSLKLPDLGAKLSDDAAMFLAAAIALRGVGSVSPNPLVGAVILDRNGCFLSAGAHLKLGGPHAEINALTAVSSLENLQDGSIFVTLEPCAHEGRTPPCAQALAKTNIKRVVYGVRDPNPAVDGQGHKLLESAGKIVELAINWQSRCEWLARVFLHNQRYQSVFTALKVASTPDGVVAGDQSSRLWITGSRARDMGHFLRLEYDAILVGINTFLLDDPTLNVRHPRISGRTPLRVVLDPNNQISQEKRSFKMLQEEPAKTLIILPGVASEMTQRADGVWCLTLPLDDKKHFNFGAIKKALWGQGVRSLLIEGGAGIYRSALSSSAVNVIHWFVSSKIAQTGLKWPMPGELIQKLSMGSGVGLESDRLIEVTINPG